MTYGTVFDIREFTVHDGPGARVTVFLKGCPLRCRWCHNPEGLPPAPQLMIRESACTRCGACRVKCSHSECQPFSRCLHACPSGLITLCGERFSSDELAKRLSGYAPFLKNGGVTFSGGEPLMQHEFLSELLTKTRPLHRAIETSGYAPQRIFREIAGLCDLVIMDLKLADREQHKKYTGVYNDVILKNLQYLQQSGREHIIRIPLIPEITDTKQNLLAAAELAGDSQVELLRYNRAAGAKYETVGKKYTLDGLSAQGEQALPDISIFRKAKIL
ncbi:MAG: glycyl-radical enzyme activating protein [Clostridia bacterium]|nr:glycyl-radical enzyme activating protein [Clostridia bacterium]